MEPLRVFERFKLDELDKTWVKSIWDNHFIIYDPMPPDNLLFVESEDMELLLKDTCSIVKNWVSQNANIDENSESEVSWQTLCALNVDQQALLALLGHLIKTGQSLNADEDSRQACLQATSLYLTLLAVPGSRVYSIFHENLYSSVMETLQLAEHLMPVFRRPTKDLASLYAPEEEPKMLQTERVTLTRGLNVIVYDLILMLGSWSLKEYPRSLEATVDALVELTKLGADAEPRPRRHSDDSPGSLAHNAYAALSELMHTRHGPLNITIKLIARYFLPQLLQRQGYIPLKTLNTTRDRTIHFLQTLLHAHGQDAELGLVILIQQMMLKCPERLEARQKQAGVIVKLINVCEGDLYTRLIGDLVFFAHHQKIPCRIFAQEIIGRLLLEENGSSPTRVTRVLLCSVLGRCVDASSMVRGRAMATLAEYTDTGERPLVKEIFTLNNVDRLMPTLDDLRSAISTDAAVLPDLKCLLTLWKSRAEDERAAVRRSALQILRNVALCMSEQLLNELVDIIRRHCRDSSMNVRRFAIQALTALLAKFPDAEGLCKQWVNAVVPQVFDVEVRVQERALEALEDLVIKRIVHNADALPWRVVSELMQMRMRRHLARACDAWMHAGVITSGTIREIVSRINTDDSIAAWALLSAISESKTLPDLQRYFLDCKGLLATWDIGEHLALEVLRNCWPAFDDCFLAKLVRDFSECLTTFSVDACAISLVLDILYAVSRQRDSLEYVQVTMRNLMDRCAKPIQAMIVQGHHSTTDVEKYLRAICTLGHCSFFCTARVPLPVLRILQGVLIDREALPSVVKASAELQAATVVVLGQQAMRELTIAHEMMPVFAQLLCSEHEDAAVRVNAAKALADVCTRFTAIVEPYLPGMCVSMKDENVAVREAILVIFIQLFAEDYVKVKDSFFFHILTMLSDTDETIREMTIFLVRERLLVKNKTLISAQFLEAILHYNDLQFGRKYERKMRQAEKTALILSGRMNEGKRRMIYDFMLENIDPPGKLKLLARLSVQVLNAVLSGTLKIKQEKAACVLKDSLYVIASENLQASSCVARDEDDEATSPPSQAAGVIAEGIRKHALSVLLPTLMRLRRKLTHDALADDVEKVFVRIASEFSRDQLSPLLLEFPQLQHDLEEGIRKYGKKCQLELAPLNSSTPRRVHPLLDCNRVPTVVLRRLSISSIENSPTPAKKRSAEATTLLDATPKPRRLFRRR